MPTGRTSSARWRSCYAPDISKPWPKHKVWIRERVVEIVSHLRTRATRQPAPSAEETSPEGALKAPGVSVSKTSLALAVLVEHPDWSVTRIAKEVGCDRVTLWRSEAFRKARSVLRQGKSETPRGTKATGRDGSGRLGSEFPSRDEDDD
jgi:hypothetical protein